MTITAPPPARSRRLLRVRGVVQGVGFRPTVYRLAVRQGLSGFVRNDPDGVTIEIEGEHAHVAAFGSLLRDHLPSAARLDAIETHELLSGDDREFRVETSTLLEMETGTSIPPDLPTCEECLAELFDPANRRHRYPFITCTSCGPRYTIVRALPYDRARTTMSSFAMCASCQHEYDDPCDRRFHSETNACASCGPRVAGEDAAVREAAALLAAGRIVAIKGIGGFHLAVDAGSDEGVARLRTRKGRPDKPFAVMARDLETVRRFAHVDDRGALALTAASRPIVCLPKRLELAPRVAPRLSDIGVMLPYAPLHHLLLTDGPPVLVMTSGNRTDEPVAIANDEAVERLSDIADSFLLHDRPIHARADDSVARVIAGRPRPFRRSRGVVPETIPLPFAAEPLLATGAELKNTVCVAAGGHASLSVHIGDLSHPESFAFFEQTIAAMTERSGPPRAIAHDLHPDYRSTRWALQNGLPRVPVQHHHAHIAACLADNERTDRVIGVAFDGTGCGPAGELWGGEILLCDLESFTRVGHLRPIALAGGEAAIREPWRVAAAALLDAGAPLDLLSRIGATRLAAIHGLVERGIRAPLATSAGRWFDAVAALCAVCDTVTYEGQAAMELESIASSAHHDPYDFVITPANEIDLRPMVRAIVADLGASLTAPTISARFHETLVHAVAAVCGRLPSRTVALSGGCFQNKRLTERMQEILNARGFDVLLHRQVPANDGGISLGQAAVAAYRQWSVRGAAAGSNSPLPAGTGAVN